MDPPANPLICPQFCLRFNDLDNIGLTGRHYSGFVMLGIQVFNKPNDYKFFKQECVQFNYRWLTQQLGIDADQITFIEDVWAGGGNLGPSIQYFVGGLELGNMVFMQYKYNHDATYEDLSVKVIDVGIGLERIPWLINGTATSYIDTFSESYKFLNEKLQIPLQNQVWETLGPYSCKLDIDQSQDIDATWQQIAKIINLPVSDIKRAIIPIRDLFIILDHTRTALMIITDGGLPSNTGGGSNCRNIIRRIFATLKKNGWWEKLGGIEGLLQLFQTHKIDLSKLYGPFKQYKSFGEIIKIQYERWNSTQDGQSKKIEQLVAKKKGKLTLDDWIMAMQAWGIPADVIANASKSEIPGNLYNQISNRAQKVAKAQQAILYDTISYPQTYNMYYQDHRCYNFDANVVGVLQNVDQKDYKGLKNIVLFDRSAFYPTSGGQVHDIGKIKIQQNQYNVRRVQKVGKCFLHYLDKQVTGDIIGKKVECQIDQDRRSTLRCFHTGTHIVFAAARRVLGPHIWQNGAKKTQNYAHLDITHYSSITQDVQMLIENEANRIILEGHKITKTFQNKKVAQQQFGFTLYQGGIVPGDTIRVVNIQDVDVEACCGTHADNTSQVGWVKIIKSARVSDGILRLYYMAGKKVMKALNQQTLVINQLKDLWGVKLEDIVPTASRFFNDYKKFEKINQNQKLSLLSMQVKFIEQQKQQIFVATTFEKLPTLYFSSVNTILAPLIAAKKTVIFVNDTLIYGLISKPQHLNLQAFKALLKEDQDADHQVQKKFIVKKGLQTKKGKQTIKNADGFQINYNSSNDKFKIKQKKVLQFLSKANFVTLK